MRGPMCGPDVWDVSSSHRGGREGKRDFVNKGCSKGNRGREEEIWVKDGQTVVIIIFIMMRCVEIGCLMVSW